LKGVVQKGDIGEMVIRFPMTCSNLGTGLCYPVPIRTIDTLGNLWVFTLGEGYGVDYAEFGMTTVKGSIATGEDEVVIPWSCDLPGEDDYGVWVYFKSPWTKN
jgi:hypothetical protein